MKKMCMIAVLFFIFFPGIVFGSYVYLYDFTGDDAEVLIEITGEGTNSITFDVQVLNPAFADLRGVWFNFDPFPSYSGDLTVTGADVTDYSFIDNGVVDLGNGATITPEGPFDAGIEIGLPGIGGGDDFYGTSFTVSSTYPENLYLGDYFGARLTSVGENREGSSKLVGTCSPVPVPATILLFGTGLIGLVGVSRKFKK
jgi:hypothetical protein